MSRKALSGHVWLLYVQTSSMKRGNGSLDLVLFRIPIVASFVLEIESTDVREGLVA